MATTQQSPPEVGRPGRPDRREAVQAVQAVLDQAWAPGEVSRPVLRPAVTLMVVVLSAAAALGIGAVLQLLHPVHLAAPAPVPVPPTIAAASFTAVSGWDCATTAGNGFDITGRTGAWVTVGRGGWSSDGCHGTFETIPMTGKATTDDTQQTVVWWFAPSAAVTRCTVSVYQPAAPQSQDAAGAAQYFVLAGRGGARLAGFVLDQSAHPGSWAPAGTFPVSPAGIAVELVDRGVPGTRHALLAVTQVRVACTA